MYNMNKRFNFIVLCLSLSAVCMAQSSPFFTGDGGKGKSIAILAPKANGLAANQNYLPALVQGEFVSNFSGYSAISVLDRLRLDEVYAEQLSGYYNDNAGLDLGRLKETDYIMTGNITRTNTGFALQIQITKSSDKITAASYSGTCTIDELTNLTGVRRASLDLLQKMGVTPTELARKELSGAAAENQVNAQTALARGIVAQQMGNTAETLAQFYQAAAYDPTLAEAAARANTMSASVRTGSMGANIRNDIAWRDEWVKILADANTALKNIPRPNPPVLPQQILVAQIILPPEPKFNQGNIDYAARTAQLTANFFLGLGLGLEPVPYPPEYLKALDAYYTAFKMRSDVYNKLVTDLNSGLRATGKNAAWKLSELSPVKRDSDPINPRSGEVAVSARAELLNDAGRAISSANIEIGRLSFGERSTTLIRTADIRQFTFTVKADDISDQMSLHITAAANPAQNNQVQVITGIIKDKAFEKKPLSDVTIPNDVISIGASAFANTQLRSVTIPNSVTFIGESAFAYNRLYSVIIPNSITSIKDSTFRDNQLSSVTIPDSVTSIGKQAFYKNYLTTVTIGNSVTSIGEEAFGGNSKFEDRSFGPIHGRVEIRIDGNSLRSVIIPNSVTSIGKRAFAFNLLTTVTIGNSVTSIGEEAFRNNLLTKITIPNSVTSIGEGAFVNNQLTSIAIGAGVDIATGSSPSFGNDFGYIYNNGGKKAGTYTLSEGRWKRK